jgi:hypothetical protein
MNPQYLRVNYTDAADLAQMVNTNSLAGKEKWLTKTPRPGDFILAAKFNHATQAGEVRLIGQVQVVQGRLQIIWKPSRLDVHPSSNGIPKWHSMPSFKFAPLVAARNNIPSECERLFPINTSFKDCISLNPDNSPSMESQTALDPGYIYVIKSKHGYKIGKSRNLKDRTRLFEVKLPFPIELEMSGWAHDYSNMERRLHNLFASKRLEGEWFNLDSTDLERLRGELGAKRPGAGA